MKKLIKAVILTSGLFSAQAFGAAIDRIDGQCLLTTAIDGLIKKEKIEINVHEFSHFGILAKGSGSNSSNVTIIESFTLNSQDLDILISTKVRGMTLSTSSRSRPSANPQNDFKLDAAIYAADDETKTGVNLECDLDLKMK